ncbi:MAG: PAC2 family protein [Chloroflexi bacterium]|nr:PAC2 family protein [Chloroflexota bacterium]
MNKAITLYKEPELRNTRLIMAWPDTGHVGLRVIDHLRNRLRAERLGRIEPHDFSLVPWISVRDGVIERLELMKNQFYYWQDSSTERDLIMFRSEQPAIRPYEYIDLVLDVASQFRVQRIYMAGSFGATGITHKEEPVVLGVTNRPDLVELLESHDIKSYPEYKGVGNIHSSFLWFARERNMEAISLWSPMPYYIARLPLPWSNYPKCSQAILEKIMQMENMHVDTRGMELQARKAETEMGKVYDELYEQAKKEFPYQNIEQGSGYADDATEAISDDDLSRMMRDIEDFFNKGQQ